MLAGYERSHQLFNPRTPLLPVEDEADGSAFELEAATFKVGTAFEAIAAFEADVAVFEAVALVAAAAQLPTAGRAPSPEGLQRPNLSCAGLCVGRRGEGCIPTQLKARSC